MSSSPAPDVTPIAHAEQPPSDEVEFTAYVGRSFAAGLGAGSKVDVVAPLTLLAKFSSNRGEMQINLDRIWRRCVHEPSACEPTIAVFVAELSDPARAEASPVDTAALRAVVRTTGQLTASRRDLPDTSPDEIVVAPLVGDLWLVCVIDTPRSTMWLNTGHLARLGLSEEKAIALAKRNLTAALAPLGSVSQPIRGDTFGYLDGDACYESSRLLLHEDWATLAAQVTGRLIISAPHSGLVIYGDAGRSHAAQVMRSAAERAAAEAQLPISPVLLEWTAGGWQPFEE